MKLNRKGFTLVELLVTIVIIGLVIGFTTFGIISVINNSKSEATVISEGSLKEAARVYSSEMGSDSWKSTEYDFDAFCVTIGELMNKGLLDKDAIISVDNVSTDTFIMVKRNKVTLAVDNEEITSYGDVNYGICTNTGVIDNENYTVPSISGNVSYTDRIEISFTDGTADSGISSYKCLYGESSSSINREGVIEGNKCIISNLNNNKLYYVYIYMNTNRGTSVLAEGNSEYRTKDFSPSTFSQSTNVVTVNYDDSNVLVPSHYFNSEIDGVSTSNVEKCELDKYNIFTCDGSSTKEIKGGTWYKTTSDSVSIEYPKEKNTIDVTLRIYDGSNNYREDKDTFNINKYTVRFYRNNASSIDGSTGTYVERSCISGGSDNCSITSPSIVAPTGYTAVGWNASNSATSSSWNASESKSINSDAEYYAIIKEITYTITYNLNGGSVTGNPSSYTAETNTFTLKNPTKTGYTFSGWTGTNVSTPNTSVSIAKGSTGNREYTANWNANANTPYKVQHWQQNIDADTTQNSTNYTLKDIENLTGTTGASITPSVKIYTGFTSPSTQSTTILADGSRVVNYYYTRNSYTVSLTKGTGISSVTGAGTYHYGKTVTIDATVSNGYLWSEWSGDFTTTEKSYTFIMPASNVSNTANATVNSYSICFDANGGSGAPGCVTKYHGVTLKLPNDKPTRTGYKFLGWSTSKTATDATYSAGGDYTANSSATLYAVWKANSYTYNIVYKSSSGVSLGTGTVAYDYGTTNTVSPKAFTGYTSPSAQSITWDSTSAKTITFTYTPISYSITYTLNGGSVSTANKTSYNIETATFTLNNPTKTSYTFSGWTGSNGTTPQTSVSIAKGSTGDKSYTANWTPKTYTITYDANGGSGAPAKQSYKFNPDVYITLSSTIPTRSGYVFLGWSKSQTATSPTYYAGDDKRFGGGTNKDTTLFAVWQLQGEYCQASFNNLPKPFLVGDELYCCSSQVTDPTDGVNGMGPPGNTGVCAAILLGEICKK